MDSASGKEYTVGSTTREDYMSQVKVIEINADVQFSNDREAEQFRDNLKKKKVFLLNLMSSPGSGKTKTLIRTIEQLKDHLTIGVIEADIESSVDAEAIAALGVKTVQLHTGGVCHLDAAMTKQGMTALEFENFDLVVLENVGNLVCPAEYDTGSSKSVMILSVPEGDDKPLKYPLMFSVVDVLLINKIDTMDSFDFDMDAVRERVKKLNPAVEIFPISAKTGEGMDAWIDWLKNNLAAWNK